MKAQWNHGDVPSAEDFNEFTQTAAGAVQRAGDTMTGELNSESVFRVIGTGMVAEYGVASTTGPVPPAVLIRLMNGTGMNASLLNFMRMTQTGVIFNKPVTLGSLPFIIKGGTVSVTPTAANTNTAVEVSFGVASGVPSFTDTPFIQVTPYSTSTAITAYGVTSRSSNGFTMNMTATNTTARSFGWLAIQVLNITG